VHVHDRRDDCRDAADVDPGRPARRGAGDLDRVTHPHRRAREPDLPRLRLALVVELDRVHRGPRVPANLMRHRVPMVRPPSFRCADVRGDRRRPTRSRRYTWLRWTRATAPTGGCVKAIPGCRGHMTSAAAQGCRAPTPGVRSGWDRRRRRSIRARGRTSHRRVAETPTTTDDNRWIDHPINMMLDHPLEHLELPRIELP